MYKDHVSSCLDLSNKIDLALFQSIAERNARVQKPRHSKQATQRTPHQRITRLLDSIHSAHDIALISSTLLDAIDNKAVLVSKLLEWLATPFRHGICRVYVGVRLLRKWKTSGVDVDDHILSFLAQANNKRRLELENVYHAISELVRSQTFSVGRYLQWLMAKGLTSPSSSEMRSVHDYPCDVGLIAHLPVSRLPEHVGNLRNTLLARAGLSADEETGIITNVKGLISQRLPAVFEKESVEGSTLYPVPADLSWSVKAEIGQWLRRGVAEHTREATNSTLRGLHSGDIAPAVSALTPEEFYNVRDILETFGDISMLADVLKCASSSDDSTVLASVADTINCHFDSLCVIGATTDLFRKLVDSYAGIKRYGMPNLDLIFSLIELGLRIPNELNTVSILRQDLSRMENKSIMAASSPVSDHIPDSFVDTDPLFREKLDQLLMSGNVMDEPTLDTLFSTLTKHLESGDDKTRLSANDTCRYLAQLRSFQPKHFDGLLARWVCGHMRSSDRSALLRILPALIGVGCVTIRSFLSLAKRLNHPTAIPNAAELPAELVELLVPQLKGGRYLDLVSQLLILGPGYYTKPSNRCRIDSNSRSRSFLSRIPTKLLRLSVMPQRSSRLGTHRLWLDTGIWKFRMSHFCASYLFGTLKPQLRRARKSFSINIRQLWGSFSRHLTICLASVHRTANRAWTLVACIQKLHWKPQSYLKSNNWLARQTTSHFLSAN